MPPKTKQARRAEDEESMCVVCTVQKSCAAQMECDHCVLCAECAFKVFAKVLPCCTAFIPSTEPANTQYTFAESEMPDLPDLYALPAHDQQGGRLRQCCRECAGVCGVRDGEGRSCRRRCAGADGLRLHVHERAAEALVRRSENRGVLGRGTSGPAHTTYISHTYVFTENSNPQEFKSRPPAYFLEQAARAHPENKLIGEFLNGLGADAAVDFAPDFASDSDDDVSAEINILSYLLAACDDEKLTLLELSPVPDLGFAGGIAIAKILARNSHVREVDFCFKFKLDDAGALEMAKTLQSNKVIDTVRFHTNGFGTAGFEALMQAVGTSTVLKTVVFDHAVNTGPQGGIALAAAVRANSSVEQISVTSFDITNRGALELAEALKTNRTLKKMFLDIATIDQIAIDALFAAFKASKTLLSMEITDYTRRLTVASLARSEIVVIE